MKARVAAGEQEVGDDSLQSQKPDRGFCWSLYVVVEEVNHGDDLSDKDDVSEYSSQFHDFLVTCSSTSGNILDNILRNISSLNPSE